MRKSFEIRIEEEQNGLTVKAVLSGILHLSRHEISRLKFADDGILLNEERTRVTQTVHTSDVLRVTFPETETEHVDGEFGRPQILYEDEDMIIVNKPAGMPCHPSHGHLKDDMGTVLQSLYPGMVIRASGRLDKDVTGVMIYAKNQPCSARLAAQRQKGILRKTYLAVCEGIFEEKEGVMEYSLQKVAGKKDRQITEGGKPCVTEYLVLSEKDDRSLVRITIRTGRTHQIRAGMSAAGHPLCGDTLYGGSDQLISRPALHCVSVVCVSPFTGKNIEINADLPEDMKCLL